MNSVSLMGRLTANPTVRYTTDNNAVATFSIAIDRPSREGEEKKTDFPRIVVFGKQAQNCEKFLKKGNRVIIIGRIQTGSYEDKNGNKVFTTDVVANRVEFIDFSSSDKNDDTSKDTNDDTFEAVDDDVPF